MGPRPRTAFLAAAAIAAAATGCGGGSDPLTAKELVAKGDEICAKGRQSFAEIQAEPPANATEAVDQTDELIGVSTDEVRQLRDLDPPVALAGRLDRYLDFRDRAIELLRRGREAADRKDAHGYADAQAKANAQVGDGEKLARAVGFRVCGRQGKAG